MHFLKYSALFFSLLTLNLLLNHAYNRVQTLTRQQWLSLYYQSPYNFWPSLLLQLFGFVYACYVSKVFQDDEDSCECSCLLLKACRPSSCALSNKLDLSVSCSQKGLWVWARILFSCLIHAEQYHHRGFPVGDLGTRTCVGVLKMSAGIFSLSECLSLGWMVLVWWLCHLCVGMILILMCHSTWLWHHEIEFHAVLY